MYRIKPIYLIAVFLVCTAALCCKRDVDPVEPYRIDISGNWKVDSVVERTNNSELIKRVSPDDKAEIAFLTDTAQVKINSPFTTVYEYDNYYLILDINGDSRTDTLSIRPGKIQITTFGGWISAYDASGNVTGRSWYNYYLTR
ncbi:MAG: hypothetical protein LPJ89_08930 [Hymenobacteraceae bacterium]|nr:hypothetical protein [Hymenobacteraceae bacterium]